MKTRLLAIAFAVLFPSLAFAQIQPSGHFTPGHAVKALNTTGSAAGDAGGANGGPPGVGLTELGITNTGLPFCINSGPTTLPYYQICMGASSQGGGLIAYEAKNGAPPLGLNFDINGTLYPFPGKGNGNVLGPNTTIIDDFACWNNTVGTLLKDCSAPTFTVVDNAALMAKPTAGAPYVIRLTFSSAVYAPATAYKASSSPCTLNGGNGDNGSQVKPNSGGGCWIADLSGEADVRVWGAVPNAAGTDNKVPLQAALTYAGSVGAAKVIFGNNVFYSSGQLNIPDGATITCDTGGGLKRFSTYTATDGRAFVTVTSPTNGVTIDGCTLDANSPGWGNWIAGISPTGNTNKVSIRRMWLDGWTARGFNWSFDFQAAQHTNAVIDSVTSTNAGASCAEFFGFVDSTISNINAISCGFHGIQFENNINTKFSNLYANKTTPPPVIQYAAAGYGPPSGTSNSSMALVGSGLATFNVSAGFCGSLILGTTPGELVYVLQTSNNNNWMSGNTVTCVGTTLTMNVINHSGAASDNSWTVTGEAGFLIGRGVGNRGIDVTGVIAINNLNASWDGIGIGENGIACTNSITIPSGLPATITCTTALGAVFEPGWRVALTTPSSPNNLRIYGTYTGGSCTSTCSLNIAVDEYWGPTNVVTDFRINSLPGTVNFSNVYVQDTGLFGFDPDSNTNVSGIEVNRAGAVGMQFAHDLGGLIQNGTVTGAVIRNTGPQDGYRAWSSTTNTVSGSLVPFTFNVGANMKFQPGQNMTVVSAPFAGANVWMPGTVTSYNIGTGSLVFTPNNLFGSGTFSSWFLTTGTGAGVSYGTTFTYVIVENTYVEANIIDDRTSPGVPFGSAPGTMFGVNVGNDQAFYSNDRFVYPHGKANRPYGAIASMNTFGSGTTAPNGVGGVAFSVVSCWAASACAIGGDGDVNSGLIYIGVGTTPTDTGIFRITFPGGVAVQHNCTFTAIDLPAIASGSFWTVAGWGVVASAINGATTATDYTFFNGGATPLPGTGYVGIGYQCTDE